MGRTMSGIWMGEYLLARRSLPCSSGRILWRRRTARCIEVPVCSERREMRAVVWALQVSGLPPRDRAAEGDGASEEELAAVGPATDGGPAPERAPVGTGGAS